MQATEHEPPAPFGPGGYPLPTSAEPPELWLREMPQTRQVLGYPPQDTQWPSKSPPRSAVLTVLKTISIGEARGAQLVICQVLVCGQKKPYAAVAKIYDSLYYSLRDSLVNKPQDVAFLADMDYSREASAYRHLQATKTRQKPGFAPEYYGSWTFESALTSQGKEHKRSIRLILIEHIAGSSILELFARNCPEPSAGLDAFHYEEAYRLDIVAEILEGVVKQLHSGLDQHDLAPRNVMLVPSPQGTLPPRSVPRVVLVDYNISIVFKYTKYGRRPHEDLSLPRNPAEYFWWDRLLDFQGWAPAKWYHKGGERCYQEWLLTRFGGENMARFAPIEKKLEFCSDSKD